LIALESRLATTRSMRPRSTQASGSPAGNSSSIVIEPRVTSPPFSVRHVAATDASETASRLSVMWLSSSREMSSRSRIIAS
jgi:hypothetical protein